MMTGPWPPASQPAHPRHEHPAQACCLVVSSWNIGCFGLMFPLVILRQLEARTRRELQEARELATAARRERRLRRRAQQSGQGRGGGGGIGAAAATPQDLADAGSSMGHASSSGASLPSVPEEGPPPGAAEDEAARQAALEVEAEAARLAEPPSAFLNLAVRPYLASSIMWQIVSLLLLRAPAPAADPGGG